MRTRRPRPKPGPASQFMLKVDRKTNGSQHLVVGTEEIAPGASIPIHNHPMEDEVVLIHSGEAHVLLGAQERDLHTGGLVFIPANTWIGLKNVSSQPLTVTFIFSAPGFDEFQRCISVPAAELKLHHSFAVVNVLKSEDLGEESQRGVQIIGSHACPRIPKHMHQHPHFVPKCPPAHQNTTCI